MSGTIIDNTAVSKPTNITGHMLDLDEEDDDLEVFSKVIHPQTQEKLRSAACVCRSRDQMSRSTERKSL